MCVNQAYQAAREQVQTTVIDPAKEAWKNPGKAVGKAAVAPITAAVQPWYKTSLGIGNITPWKGHKPM